MRWAGIYLLGWAGFIALLLAANNPTLLQVDLTLAQRVQDAASPRLTTAMEAITAIGYTAVATVLIVLVAAGFWLVHWRLEAAALLISPLGELLDTLAKLIGHRPRPAGTQLHVETVLSSYGFPSGHAVFATYFFGLLILFLLSRVPATPLRGGAIIAGALLILLIGISRVYLGEHWPSDVLGGYWLGGLWLTTLGWAYKRLARRRVRAAPSALPA